MAKQEQCYKARKQKKNRLPKIQYKKYTKFLAQKYPICQDKNCNCMTDDHHHVLYGAYKDDKTLINLCRFHHEEAHKNKRESQEKYRERAKMNWEEYCEIV